MSSKVLFIGGKLDGQWKNVHRDLGDTYRHPTIPPFTMEERLTADITYDEYRIMEIPLTIFGAGRPVRIALLDSELQSRMSHEAVGAKILRAILKRDVATEMGL